jgi:hypothetical protein
VWRVGAVVTRRGAGKLAAAKKSSAKKHKPVNKNFWQHLSRTGRFPKPTNKTNNMITDIHTYINNTMADNHKYIFNLTTITCIDYQGIL